MSMHDYENSVGRTFRDVCGTVDDLSKEAIAKMVREGRHIMSSTLWGRYRHQGRHRTLGMFGRAYATLLLALTPSYA